MSYTTFKPMVWADIIDRELKKNLVFGQLANRKYEGLISEMGDKVKIPSITSVEIQDYTGADISFSEDIGTEQIIDINKAKAFGIAINDIDKAQAMNGVLDIRAMNAVYRLADDMDMSLSKLHTKVVTANKVTCTLGTDKITHKIVDLGTALDKTSVPKTGRWLVLSPDAHGELIKDVPNISQGEQTFEVNKDYYVGKWGGFEIYVSNNTEFKDKAYHCLAGVTAGLTLARQLNKIEAGRFEKNFKDYIKGLNLYGCDVLETEQGKTALLGVLIVKQATS